MESCQGTDTNKCVDLSPWIHSSVQEDLSVYVLNVVTGIETGLLPWSELPTLKENEQN